MQQAQDQSGSTQLRQLSHVALRRAKAVDRCRQLSLLPLAALVGEQIFDLQGSMTTAGTKREHSIRAA
jgi:hypothetical protein